MCTYILNIQMFCGGNGIFDAADDRSIILKLIRTLWSVYESISTLVIQLTATEHFSFFLSSSQH